MTGRRWSALREGINRGRRWNGSDCWGLGNHDSLLAGWAVDLHSRMTGVAQNMLAASRAEEFEFSHDFFD